MTELVTLNNNQPVTSSRMVAEKFGKIHKNVIRNIQGIECSEEFNRLNFELVNYKDAKGEKRPEYIITKDGFTFLVMGFTGKEAAKFKEEYIYAFKKDEEQLKLVEQKTLDKHIEKLANKQVKEALENILNPNSDPISDIDLYAKIKLATGISTKLLCKEMGIEYPAFTNRVRNAKIHLEDYFYIMFRTGLSFDELIIQEGKYQHMINNARECVALATNTHADNPKSIWQTNSPWPIEISTLNENGTTSYLARDAHTYLG